MREKNQQTDNTIQTITAKFQNSLSIWVEAYNVKSGWQPLKTGFQLVIC